MNGAFCQKRKAEVYVLSNLSYNSVQKYVLGNVSEMLAVYEKEQRELF